MVSYTIDVKRYTNYPIYVDTSISDGELKTLIKREFNNLPVKDDELILPTDATVIEYNPNYIEYTSRGYDILLCTFEVEVMKLNSNNQYYKAKVLPNSIDNYVQFEIHPLVHAVYYINDMHGPHDRYEVGKEYNISIRGNIFTKYDGTFLCTVDQVVKD